MLLSIAFILLGVFMFSGSYIRFGESVVDFGMSVKFYFSEMFMLDHNTIPSVLDMPKVFEDVAPSMPSDPEVFEEKTITYFELLTSADNLKAWFKSISNDLSLTAKILTAVLPMLAVLVFAVKKIYTRPNNKHGIDRLPLKAAKKISDSTYQPAKRLMLRYFAFLQTYKWILIFWLILWVLNLNLASIVVSFLAYYFYFAMSFDFGTIYSQLVKLSIDLDVLFTCLPWYLFLPFGFVLFHKMRVSFALSRLRHMEAKNCGFINELPIVSLTCGSMGKKKTTAVTDMALSQEVMFRQKAFEILKKCDMKFPNFPWICFEIDMQKAMEVGTIFNLASIKQWVREKRSEFLKNEDRTIIYNYNTTKHKLDFDDSLHISNLFDVLETYALAYFIYVIESSLLVSNYSIREDNMLVSEGNFPLWNTNFFPKKYRENSRHSHILDFDVLRLGRKVIENNMNNGSFEFGVVVITEIGKERGNSLELKEVKKGADNTNQKNDMFNSWLKMCRHSATVDNFPFIKVFTDEQRPESWGADARDLCDIVTIIKSNNTKLALPFYALEEMICDVVFTKFIRLYYDLRFLRGDNTLLVHILKRIASVLFAYNLRVQNRYGYTSLNIAKERGVMDGKQDKKKYYLMNKKIYSSRFSTDCFSDYFDTLAKNTRVGINDYTEYVNEKASVDELKMQNSYFIDSLYSKGGD